MPKYYYPKWTWITVSPYFTIEHPGYWWGQSWQKLFTLKNAVLHCFLSFRAPFPKNLKVLMPFLCLPWNSTFIERITRPIAISGVFRAFSDGPTDRLTDRPTDRPIESGLSNLGILALSHGRIEESVCTLFLAFSYFIGWILIIIIICISKGQVILMKGSTVHHGV